MKTNSLLLAVLLVLAMPLAPAEDLSLRVLAVPAPALEAVITPETTRLDAISDDGRWLLLTSASDRLVTNDLNAALDVVLFDRATSQFTLLSATAAGRSGKGTSFAGDMSADGQRIVFASRAPDLVPNDANEDWDVVIRDVAASTSLLVSVTAAGKSGTGASGRPQLSADGRYVLLESEARDLTLQTDSSVRALYRRDLQRDQTVWASADTSALGIPFARTEAARMTPDGRFVAYAVTLPTGQTNRLYLRDVVQSVGVELSAQAPANFADKTALRYGRVALSDTAAEVACRAYYGSTNACFYYAVGAGSVTALGLETNAFPASVPEELRGPELSATGRFVAYAQSMPVADTTNLVVQVFRWDAVSGEPTLVSSRAGSTEFSDGHAFGPRITADGRSVAYLSHASDLMPGLTGHALRAFLWDGQTGTTKLLAELGEAGPVQELILSRNGAWLAYATPAAPEFTRCFVVEIATQQVTTFTLQPAVTNSLTGRGWIALHPSGVSADGRYVSYTAIPAGSGESKAAPQVYLADTVAGTRRLVTQNHLGEAGNAWANVPSITPDGARLLYTCAATNFDGGSQSNRVEPYCSTSADLRPQWIRPASLPANARYAGQRYPPVVPLNPTGRCVWLSYFVSDWSRYALTLLDLETWTFSPPLLSRSPWASTAPSFSRDGTVVACLQSVAGLPPTRLVEVLDVTRLMRSATDDCILWRTSSDSGLPTVSGDGRRVGYTQLAGQSAQIVVVDLPLGREVFRQDLGKASVSGLALSDGGQFVVWMAVRPAVSPMSQVAWADAARRTTLLASVARDNVSPGNGPARLGAISANGRYVAFASLADNLVAEDENRASDVFLRDMWRGETLRVSPSLATTDAEAWSGQPFFSADGRSLFFVSRAPNPAPGDYNQAADLFVARILDGDLLAVIRRGLTASRAEVLWTGLAGKTYRVEYKDAVDDPTWQTLATAAGPDARVEVNASAAHSRMFRVVEEP